MGHAVAMVFSLHICHLPSSGVIARAVLSKCSRFQTLAAEVVMAALVARHGTTYLRPGGQSMLSDLRLSMQGGIKAKVVLR